MDAKFYTLGDVLVIKLEGRIQPDQNKPFRDMCEQKLINKKVIFCVDQLSFTASANILTFFESIGMIAEAKVVGLQHDFFRLIELRGLKLKTYKSLKDAMSETEFNPITNGDSNSLSDLEID